MIVIGFIFDRVPTLEKNEVRVPALYDAAGPLRPPAREDEGAGLIGAGFDGMEIPFIGPTFEPAIHAPVSHYIDVRNRQARCCIDDDRRNGVAGIEFTAADDIRSAKQHQRRQHH